MEPIRITRALNELMRRKVVRVAIGYSMVMWILLQIAEVTFEPLHLPDWTLTFLVVIAIIGFPVAAILAWAFEVTPEGLIRDPQDAPQKSPTDNSNNYAAVKKDTYRSVAVLPFADMSAARDQGYFCEGIAEEILSSLSTVKCLRVPSRTSSFRFNTDDEDIRAIGRALDVEAVLEGSVRKEGERMRITAQLIDARNGYHIWASSYDRHVSAVFKVQRELSEDIVRQLCESLNPGETAIREPISVADIHAYDYYLQGRHFLNRFTEQGVEFSIRMFTQAIELDPGFSLAWAGLAEAHTYEYLYHESRQEHRDKARDAAEKAVGLAPESAPCRTVHAMALMIAGRYAEADIEFRSALSMNPMQFSASYYYARNCQAQGKLEQAAELFESASRRRPEDYQAPLLALAIYRRLGRRSKARDAALRGTKAAQLHLLLHPDDTRALYLAGSGLLELGQERKARRWIERAVELNPTDGLVRYNAACFYAQSGDFDQAFDCLRMANNSGVDFAEWMDNDPDLEPLRGDQRFPALLQSAEGTRASSGLVAESHCGKG